MLVEVFLNEHNWRLLYKRHVDTVILCSIYGVARMYNVEISFHDIIVHYKSQPQCTYDVRCLYLQGRLIYVAIQTYSYAEWRFFGYCHFLQ